jgi:hypothetical protein
VEVIGGVTAFRGRSRPAWSSGAGLRRRLGLLAVGLDLSATRVGDTSFADMIGVARWLSGRLEAAGFLGVRGLSQGGGRGVYAEATVLYALARGLTLYAGGGRYPSDPLRGSIAGRYVSAGLRFAAGGGGAPRHRPPSLQLATMGARPETAGHLAGATLVVVAGTDSVRLVRVVSAEAQRVELMGDFTDWEPVALVRIGADTWEIRLPVSPGVHRLNVRIDGGPWLVPAGTRLEHTEFGGAVGVVVIP